MVGRVYFGGYQHGEFYFSTPSGAIKKEGFVLIIGRDVEQRGVASPIVEGDPQRDIVARGELENKLAEAARRNGADIVAKHLGRKNAVNHRGKWVLLKMTPGSSRKLEEYMGNNPREDFKYY